jgi:hypothetical protein
MEEFDNYLSRPIFAIISLSISLVFFSLSLNSSSIFHLNFQQATSLAQKHVIWNSKREYQILKMKEKLDR